MDGDFRLGDWLVQPALCRLSKDGRTVQVRARVMDLLTYLAARPGEVVSKDRLLNDVWRTQAVSESALTRTVTELRQALGDSADDPRLLETIAKRGYRLIGPVVPLAGGPILVAPAPTRRVRAWGRIVLTAAGLALLIGGATWARLASRASEPPVRVAILPFDNLGEGLDRAYLADGLVEDTIVSLGMIDPEHLTVIGRTSTGRYKDTSKSLPEIGRELQADYIVDGTVRTEGPRLRLTSKLFRVSDQAVIWTQSYEHELTSVLGLQLEISADVARQIRSRLSPERLASVERRQTRNADAYDAYMHGRWWWLQRRPPATRRAIEYYERATAIDPAYALAWSGMADAYTASPVNGDAVPLNMLPLARHAVREALRLAPNLAEVQTSESLLNFWLERNLPAAESAARRAIVLNSNYQLAHLSLANVLSHSGRHREAQEQIRRAREADPLEPMMIAISSQIAFHARDYPGAVKYARQALIVDPEFWIAYMPLGLALERMGKSDLALDAFDKARRFSGGNSKALSATGYVLGTTGRTAEARDVLKALMTLSLERYVPPSAIALVHAGLGQRDAAFESLNAACAAHDVHLVFLPVDPKWDSYRSDPAFKKRLGPCGFTQQSRSNTPDP